MSRSGYSEEGSNWEVIRWRGAVASAIRGRRGQAFLNELKTALEALPVRRLIRNELVSAEGEYCTLGAIGAARGIDMQCIDPDNADQVAHTFGIAPALAREIVFENDEWDSYYAFPLTPEARWKRMHKWVCRQLQQARDLKRSQRADTGTTQTRQTREDR